MPYQTGPHGTVERSVYVIVTLPIEYSKAAHSVRCLPRTAHHYAARASARLNTPRGALAARTWSHRRVLISC